MIDHRLSTDEITALTFAARRQLTRWANSPNPRYDTQRTALVRALRILSDEAFTKGCELVPSEE